MWWCLLYLHLSFMGRRSTLGHRLPVLTFRVPVLVVLLCELSIPDEGIRTLQEYGLAVLDDDRQPYSVFDNPLSLKLFPSLSIQWYGNSYRVDNLCVRRISIISYKKDRITMTFQDHYKKNRKGGKKF